MILEDRFFLLPRLEGDIHSDAVTFSANGKTYDYGDTAQKSEFLTESGTSVTRLVFTEDTDKRVYPAQTENGYAITIPAETRCGIEDFCSQSIQIRISLKGRFFGIFWLIVAHRRQPYVLRFTKIYTKSDSDLSALAMEEYITKLTFEKVEIKYFFSTGDAPRGASPVLFSALCRVLLFYYGKFLKQPLFL